MAAKIYKTPKLKIGTNGRYEMEAMHLMDTQADEEKALCGANVPADDLTGVDNYMERRKDGLPVGTVCQDCKTLAMPIAEAIIEDMAQALEDEGRLGGAEDYRDLLNRLARETGQDRRAGLIGIHARTCMGLFCVS